MKAIIFDFDGVIHDSFEFHRNKIIEYSGVHLTTEIFADMHNGNFFSSIPENIKNIKWEGYRDFIYCEQSQLIIEEKIKNILVNLSLKYQLYIVTSGGTKNIEDNLHNNDMSSLFGEVLGLEKHRSKVDKFNYILKNYNLKSKDCIFVTDTLGDILEAHKVNIPTLAVDFGFHNRKTLAQGNPYKIISHLSEIEYIKKIGKNYKEKMNPTNTKNNSTQYDYIFCGIGAGSSLLLGEMYRSGLLKNKKVCIIDKDTKMHNDKTFCFWSRENELITQNLSHIISKSWSEIDSDTSENISLKPFKYRCVQSIDVYNSTREIIQEKHIDRYYKNVDEYEKMKMAHLSQYEIKSLRAEIIFDSRTPIFEDEIESGIHILQSFTGWYIETYNEIDDPEAFRFMDFTIDQLGSCQFMYVLPMSPNKILVEVTRFGAHILLREQAEKILHSYILSKYGKYKKNSTEIGCIPMSTRKIKNIPLPGVIPLGARNYNIKASSGFAFKNMFAQAQEITQQIYDGNNLSISQNSEKSFFSKRFALYDTLLLDILKNSPEKGKIIFTSLLQKNPVQKLFLFLEEKTKLRDEISIFLRLPKIPFMRALLKKITSFEWFYPFLLIIITSLLLLLGKYSSFQEEIGYALLFIGLLLIGIPHGAVDHLLESGKWDTKKAPKFIGVYILLGSIIGILWFIAPSLALIVFLIYSAWHFGEADGKKWNFSSGVSFLWGASVLTYILGTHSEEAHSIISSMGGMYPMISVPFWGLLPWFLYALLYKKISFFFTLVWITLSSQIPLLLAFGIYFILQHSYMGWTHLQKHLRMKSSSIWMQSLPFHMGAWVLLGIFYFFFNNLQIIEKFGEYFLFF